MAGTQVIRNRRPKILSANFLLIALSAFSLFETDIASPQETKLLRFLAVAGDEQVEISWETQNETDLAGFILQRSEEDSSANFETIGSYQENSSLVAKGTERRYSRIYLWMDQKLINGKQYWYRLKAVNQSGGQSNLGIVTAIPVEDARIYQSSEVLGWEWQNPLPTGNRLNDVDFVDSEHGWIVGDFGTILRTVDGGRSWKFLDHGITFLTQSWPNQIHFSEVDFFDALNGVVGGYSETVTESDVVAWKFILRTTDGGETWKTTFRYRNGNASFWRDMFFLDSKMGWLLIESVGTFRTLDGGYSWTKISNVPSPFSIQPGVTIIPTSLYKLYFTNPDTGWGLLGEQVIYYTTDGGKNWSRKFVPELSTTNGIVFIDQRNGWLYDESGKIYRTADGGNSWQIHFRIEEAIPQIIHFWDQSNGIIVAQAGSGIKTVFYKTTDGGNTWVLQPTEVSAVFLGIHFLNENEIWAVGPVGAVWHSKDRGHSWNVAVETVKPDFIDIQFVSLEKGWALGNALNTSLNLWQGVLLTTKNGGRNWEVQERFPDYMVSIDMVDDQHGWAAAGRYNDLLGKLEGAIYRTSDDWQTWQRMYFDNLQLFDLVAFDAQHACACGSKGAIFSTYDGRSSWHHAVINSSDSSLIWFHNLFFVDASLGWVTGSQSSSQDGPWYGALFQTRDGGNTWNMIYQNIGDQWLWRVTFVDTLQGWAIGQGADGLIYHTVDGGYHWIEQNPDLPWHNFLDLCFIDPLHGWAVSHYGQIIYTEDGGNKWIKERALTGDLTALTFIDPIHGWVAGYGGRILQTAQAGLIRKTETGVQIKSQTERKSYRLLPNYPNPFNASTIISYELPENAKVTLRIYNLLGQEVRALLSDKNQPAGSHQVTWDGTDNTGKQLPSGLYFFQIKTEHFVEVKKMILAK